MIDLSSSCISFIFITQVIEEIKIKLIFHSKTLILFIPFYLRQIWLTLSLFPLPISSLFRPSSAFPETLRISLLTIGLEWWTVSLTRRFRRCHLRNGRRACCRFCVNELVKSRIVPSGRSLDNASGAFAMANELPTESLRSFVSRSVTKATWIV